MSKSSPTKVTEGTRKCSICKRPMLIQDESREVLGLPMDSHLDCLLKTKGNSG